MRKNDATLRLRQHVFFARDMAQYGLLPTLKVTRPSMRKSHRQPAIPLMPSIWSKANASSDVAIPVRLLAVQKKPSRIGSSRLV